MFVHLCLRTNVLEARIQLVGLEPQWAVAPGIIRTNSLQSSLSVEEDTVSKSANSRDAFLALVHVFNDKPASAKRECQLN